MVTKRNKSIPYTNYVSQLFPTVLSTFFYQYSYRHRQAIFIVQLMLPTVLTLTNSKIYNVQKRVPSNGADTLN